jgi:hypothetical protein
LSRELAEARLAMGTLRAFREKLADGVVSIDEILSDDGRGGVSREDLESKVERFYCEPAIVRFQRMEDAIHRVAAVRASSSRSPPRRKHSNPDPSDTPAEQRKS